MGGQYHDNHDSASGLEPPGRSHPGPALSRRLLFGRPPNGGGTSGSSRPLTPTWRSPALTGLRLLRLAIARSPLFSIAVRSRCVRPQFNNRVQFTAIVDRVDHYEMKMTSMDQERWLRVKDRLRIEVGEDIYLSWFARMELDAVEVETIQVS